MLRNGSPTQALRAASYAAVGFVRDAAKYTASARALGGRLVDFDLKVIPHPESASEQRDALLQALRAPSAIEMAGSYEMALQPKPAPTTNRERLHNLVKPERVAPGRSAAQHVAT